MSFKHRSIVIPCIALFGAACGGQISIGDLGGFDASTDGSADGHGGAAGNAGASTGSGSGGATAGAGGATAGNSGQAGTSGGFAGSGGATTGTGGAGGTSGGAGGTSGGAGGASGGAGGASGGAGGASGGAGGTSGGAGGLAGAGGQGGSADASPDVGGPTGRCASGVFWTGGNNASALMSPGRPCMGSGCHTASSKTAVTMAGTIYSSNGLHDDNDCNGKDGAGIAVVPFDDMGNEFLGRLQVNAAGNFFTSKAVPPSFRVKVLARGQEFRMMAPVTDGNCNYCHSPDGFMSAAGRIVDAGCLGALYLMVDSSGSMDMIDSGQTATRWDSLAQAIAAFTLDLMNADMMVGLDFFPEVPPSDGGLSASCVVADYTLTNVPVDLIPGFNNSQSDAIVAAMRGRARVGGTPTTPALTGALQAARAWQMMHPDRILNVVFLTDGQPTGCSVSMNTVQGAAAVAQSYATGLPSIKTYVLGVGPDTGTLDSIAAAGGTQTAYMATDGSAAGITNALRAVAAAACRP